MSQPLTKNPAVSSKTVCYFFQKDAKVGRVVDEIARGEKILNKNNVPNEPVCNFLIDSDSFLSF